LFVFIQKRDFDGKNVVMIYICQQFITSFLFYFRERIPAGEGRPGIDNSALSIDVKKVFVKRI